MRLKGEIFNFRERAGCGMSVSCPDHARIMLESTFYRRQHRSNLELAFEEVVWDFYCSRGVRNEFVTSLWLCLYSRMHVGGTVRDDFFVLQVYKAVAGTVICEVWGCPRYSLRRALQALFRHVCLRHFHCILDFTVGVLCEFRSTYNTFGTLSVSCFESKPDIIQVSSLRRYDSLQVRASIFRVLQPRVGSVCIVLLRFAFHRQIRALYWTFHA